MTNEVRIVEIWAVYQGDTDIQWGQPKWFFLTKEQAEIVAKGS